MAGPHPVDVFLLGIKAVAGQVGDLDGQQVAMLVQLFDIKVNASLFFVFARQFFARRGLCNGQGVSGVVCDIDDR